MNNIDSFARLINNQRLRPKIWDYSYLLLKNNLDIFRQFRELVVKENKRKILDVGCGFKPWLELFDRDKIEYIGVDFDKARSSADFIAPADRLPFPSNEFDALIYSEVLEHTNNIYGVIDEMRRVARQDALVYVSSPFIFPEHGIPYDFQRLTRYYYQCVFKEDEIVVLKESNSSLSTVFVSFNMVAECTPFAAMSGVKHFIYSVANILGLACDFAVGFLMKITWDKFRHQFYSMPLGYALVVRVKK